MPLTIERPRDILQKLFEEHVHLCAQHRAIGIEMLEAAMGERKVPDGWRLDTRTNYWIPPSWSDGNSRRH